MKIQQKFYHKFKNNLPKLLSYFFIILVILFFVVYLRKVDFKKIEQIDINWWLVGLATVFATAYVYWATFIWCVILKDLGSKKLPHYSIMADIYAKAWMGRYIPGTVTWIASKIYMASSYGISKSRLTVSSLLEGAMQVVATTAVAMVLIGFDPRINSVPSFIKIMLVVIGAMSLVILSPPIFNRFMKLAHKILKRKEVSEELNVNKKAIAHSFLLYVLGAFISGTAYFFVTIAIYPSLGAHQYFYLVGTFLLAGAIGVATPFVPSGIGIRDGVQLVLLAAVMPKEIALAVVVFTRLWSAACDVLFYITAHGYKKLTKKTSGNPIQL